MSSKQTTAFGTWCRQAARLGAIGAALMLGWAAQAAPGVQATATANVVSVHYPDSVTFTDLLGPVTATHAAASATTSRRAIDLDVIGDGLWTPDAVTASGVSESRYTVRNLETGQAVDPASLGLQLDFHFSVLGTVTLGQRTGGLVEDVVLTADLQAWVYGGPATSIFQTDYSAICTAPKFGGCSLDVDGDWRLMSDNQAPNDASVAFGFSLGHTGGTGGTLWMSSTLTASAGERADYRLQLDRVSFSSALSAARMAQRVAFASPPLAVFLDDGTQLPLQAAPIPEPATALLLAAGLAGVAGVAGRRRRSLGAAAVRP